MHRKITAFLQHVQGILATIGQSCNVLGHFRNTAQGIFAAFRKLYFPQHNLVLRWAILPLTTSSQFKQGSAMNVVKSNRLYFISQSSQQLKATVVQKQHVFWVNVHFVLIFYLEWSGKLTMQLNLIKKACQNRCAVPGQ